MISRYSLQPSPYVPGAHDGRIRPQVLSDIGGLADCPRLQESASNQHGKDEQASHA